MWQRLTAENAKNWIGMIDKLVNECNNRKNSLIKMMSKEARKKQNKEMVFGIKNAPLKIKNVQKFNVGDFVWISRIKGLFEKGYLRNWLK